MPGGPKLCALFLYIIPHTFRYWIKNKYNRCRNSSSF